MEAALKRDDTSITEFINHRVHKSVQECPSSQKTKIRARNEEEKYVKANADEKNATQI